MIVFFTGTRFRPLSLDSPKPLFPIAGLPIIQHHIEACSKVKGFLMYVSSGRSNYGRISKRPNL